jgi:hypothetical protein
VRFLEAVGFAFDGEDLGIVDEAVDQGDDAGGVGEDLVPFCERPVGGHDRALVLVAAADELEQQVGMAVGVGQVADLVDDQKAGRRRARAVDRDCPAAAASSGLSMCM